MSRRAQAVTEVRVDAAPVHGTRYGGQDRADGNGGGEGGDGSGSMEGSCQAYGTVATHAWVDARSAVESRFDFEKILICLPRGREKSMWICILSPSYFVSANAARAPAL